MELKKLLMSGAKEQASGWPGSPKTEGAGKKGASGQQVCGQKLLPQPPRLPSLCCHLWWQ